MTPSTTPSRTDPERGLLVPEPRGAARRGWTVAGLAWLALMLVIPLRYYLGDDLYDERFAWRMFSAVRVQTCAVQVTEDRGEGPQRLALMEVLPAPWTALLERHRPAVVARFLAWRCEVPGMQSVSMTSVCRDAAGQPLPAVERTRTCTDGRVRVQGPSAGETP